MFDSKTLAILYRDHRGTLDGLVALESTLNGRFYGMDRAVTCMMLAALTGEAMVMIGPPGTAKSRLVRSFCNLVGILDDAALTLSAGGTGTETKHERYFEYLLTQFTEPSELFGYYDLARLFVEHTMIRADDGMMQKAEVVFLDEVFNASSAILNALLTFMNERKFHDRGLVQRTPMRLLFSATNSPPREEGLGAVYDRFLLRCRLDNVAAQPDMLAGLVSAAWNETHDTPGRGKDARFGALLDGFDRYRDSVDAQTHAGNLRVQQDSPLFNHLADMVTELRRKELSLMSNRRLVKFSGVILANSLLRAARARSDAPRIEPVDLEVILDYGLDAEDKGTVDRLRSHLRPR
ncbi:MAG: AAA family ATPase [Gemmobacter sp.]